MAKVEKTFVQHSYIIMIEAEVRSEGTTYDTANKIEKMFVR